MSRRCSRSLEEDAVEVMLPMGVAAEMMLMGWYSKSKLRKENMLEGTSF